jgi:uncharacterized protein with GYD domain
LSLKDKPRRRDRRTRSARARNQGGIMPTYVALIDWTEQGVRNFKDTVDR